MNEPTCKCGGPWSCLHDRKAVLVALNTHGTEGRGADVTVDATIRRPGATLSVLYRGDWDLERLIHPPGDEKITVREDPDGRAFVHIDLPATGMAILA